MQNRVVSKSLNKNHPNDEKSNKSAITKTHISAMHLYYASFSAMKNHRSAQKCSQFCPGPRSASLPRRTKLSPITTQERSWSHTSDHSAQYCWNIAKGTTDQGLVLSWKWLLLSQFASLSKFSLVISTKLKPQKLNQMSALKSWPNFSFDDLTNIQLQNFRSSFSLNILTKIQL